MPSNKAKENNFITKESSHIIMSTAFSLLSTISLLIILIFSILLSSTIVLVPIALLLTMSIVKFIYQLINILKFNKLTKTIDDDHISFYITKSWIRKREATIWVGFIVLIIISFPLIAALVTINKEGGEHIFEITSLFSLIIVSVVVGYLNMQNLESNLKISERKMNMHSVEWMQIKKETKIFYRLSFIYFISILTIVPFLMLIIPGYRNWLYKLVR